MFPRLITLMLPFAVSFVLTGCFEEKPFYEGKTSGGSATKAQYNRAKVSMTY